MIEEIIKIFSQNTLNDYILFVFVLCFLFFTFKVCRTILAKKIVNIFSNKIKFIEILSSILEKNRPILYTYVSFFVASQFLDLGYFLSKLFFDILIILIVFEFILTYRYFIKIILSLVLKKSGNKGTQKAFGALFLVFEIILWIIAILFLASNFGFDITALATGLGISGIAIAFAIKAILEDLFAYLTILLDKPVEKGDYIVLKDGSQGTIKEIGLKTTKLLNHKGTETIISNSKITDGVLDNLTRVKYRREKIDLHLSLKTKATKIFKLKEEIKKIIKKEKKVDLNRIFVKKIEIDAFIFNIDISINELEYNPYAEILERINLEVISCIEKQKIDLIIPGSTFFKKTKK